MLTLRHAPKVLAVLILMAGIFASTTYSETAGAAAPKQSKGDVVNGRAVYELSEQERKALTFDAGPETRPMVQFFTSDANPICNDAVKWIATLTQKEGQLWKNFVPIAMHVRLWDSSRYRDAYAKDDFDVFIKSYSLLWSLSHVFVPLVVVNGMEWAGWARGQDIPLANGAKGGMLHVDGTERPNNYNAIFKPDSTIDTAGGLQFHSALLGFGLQSRPSDGKNRGNVLSHDFIALLYKSAVLKSGGDGWKASVELPKPRGFRRVRFAVVFWVTKNGSPIPLQAVGGFLPGA